METVRRRRCATCQFHSIGPTPCTGTCLNKSWQPNTDAIRFVRDRELACYRGWGIDSWQPRQGLTPANGSGPAGAGGGGAGGGTFHSPPNNTLAGAPTLAPESLDGDDMLAD